MSVDPPHPLLPFLQALQQDGQTDEAIENYQSAVRIDPNHIAGERLDALGAERP